jgi:hypothetical protein
MCHNGTKMTNALDKTNFIWPRVRSIQQTWPVWLLTLWNI